MKDREHMSNRRSLKQTQTILEAEENTEGRW